jgi:hypothetical protein
VIRLPVHSLSISACAASIQGRRFVLGADHAEAVSEQASSTDRWLDWAATALLALATVATAWSAYQSRQWTGEQSQAYSRATATRIAVNRSSAVANRQVQIDVATFIQWVDARALGRAALAGFYRNRFRDEFKPAFDAWLATKPFTNAHAPPTPFALPEYRLQASEAADALDRSAALDSDRAKDANERADNYMLAVVLFASSIFFAGMSAKLRTRNARIALLALGCVVFAGTIVWLATLPVQLTT